MAARKDTDIVADVSEARRLCSPDTTARVKKRDRNLPCSRCGTAMRWDVNGNHPLGVTLDHRGIQVADCVGMPRGQARRLLNDMSQLALSHRVCNTRDGRGHDRPPGALTNTAVPTTTRTASREW